MDNAVLTPAECDDMMKDVLKRARLYLSGRVGREECFYTTLISLVRADDACMEKCLNSLPDEFCTSLHNYAQEFLSGSDFMPTAAAFIFGPVASDEYRELQLQMRPRYIALYEAIVRRHNGVLHAK